MNKTKEEKLEKYIYRRCHICFAQAIDRSNKNHDKVVEENTKFIMEKVEEALDSITEKEKCVCNIDTSKYGHEYYCSFSNHKQLKCNG